MKKYIIFEGSKIIDRTGEKRGRLVALYPTKKVGTKIYWMFECECKKRKEIRADQVFVKENSVRRTLSCGCLHSELNNTIRKEQLITMSKTHGMSNTRFYRIWKKIKSRCNNPKDIRYSNYGGRGISICKQWNSFEGFKNDMYDSYLNHCTEFGEENTTIERKNVNDDYYKENCIWATPLKQANNKVNTVYVRLISGEKISIHEYCRLVSKNYNTCRSRYVRSKYYKNKEDIPEELLKENTEVIN